MKPINYTNKEKIWKFIGISNDNDNFKLNDIAIWSHKWQEIPNRFAHVKDPSYGQEFEFQVYFIEHEGNRIEFATGEFSSNVWGIYIQNK